MTRHDMLASLLRKKAALTYKDPAVVAAMDAARPVQQARWLPFTMDGKEKGQEATQPTTYSLKVPIERAAADSNRDVVNQTEQADANRYANEIKEELTGIAQREGGAPAGVHLGDYQKARASIEKSNRNAARDWLYSKWEGDANRTPEQLYEQMAQARYTDSRWQAFKNWVRRGFGSTDKDAQRTYKNWRGYDREKIRNTGLPALDQALDDFAAGRFFKKHLGGQYIIDALTPRDSGFWTAGQGEDSDLDALKAEAHARIYRDTRARARAAQAASKDYEASMPTGMDVTRLPSEFVRYATDKDGNVVQTTDRNTHPYVSKDQFYAGARQWADRVAQALHALPGSRAYGLVMPALTQYANGTRWGVGQGRTLEEILRQELTDEEFRQVIDNFRNSTAYPSEYTMNRLLNSRY